MLSRQLESETLDHLPESDPRAVRSRRDLRRVNRFMGSLTVLEQLLDESLSSAPHSLAELGSGDGSLMLRLAERRSGVWPRLVVTLVDRQRLLAAETQQAYMRCGWHADVAVSDVMEWLEHADGTRYDAITANLFLHHFDSAGLQRMFRAIAQRTDCFVACEPRRDRLSLSGSHLIGALGVNDVTRNDAVLSVRAGFVGRELSALWPDEAGWVLTERRARAFSHAFAAMRRA